MQLVDELNMIYTACLMNYASWSFAKSRFTRQLLGGGLLSLAIFITVRRPRIPPATIYVY
jgi:dihydroceramidase